MAYGKPKRGATSTDPNFQPPRADPEFYKLLPIRTPKEFAALESQLYVEGCLDAIRVWDEENIVTDGYTRFEICKRHNIPYRVEYFSYEDRDQVKRWMVHNQLNKRNLTDKQRDYYIGEEYMMDKKSPGQPKKDGAEEGKTAEEVGRKNKVSARKVQLDAKYSRACNAHERAVPGTLKKILAGEFGSKKHIIETAPILCDRCIRVGIVKNCTGCAALLEDEKKKRRAKTPKSLFDEKPKKPAKGEPEKKLEPYDEIQLLSTKLSGLMTKFLTAEGEVSMRLGEYLKWCGLLDFPAKGTPKFIALAGVRMLVEAAGEKGPILTQATVLARYTKACGAEPWVPPATKYRRAQKARRNTNLPD